MTSISCPFLAFAADAADVATLKEFAHEQGFDADCVYQGTIVQASAYLKNNPSPELLLVELPSQEEAAALLDQLADVVDPNTKVIAIGTVNEYSFYCWLTDIGIFSYLLKPLTMGVLEATYQKSKATVAGAKPGKAPAKVIAVMGARGGVGSTTVAINLAAILAEQTRKHVALVDLDPQEGSVALALDIEPSRGLRDVLEKPDRIDALFLDRVMAKVGSHLSVLSAEESLAEKLAINEHAAEPLLRELREKYDYVVLDVPRHMNHFIHTCLKQAEHPILVTELSLLCLRDTLRLQDAMRDTWKNKPPIVVANRMGLATKHEVPAPDFEKGANVKVNVKVPFTPDVFMVLERQAAAVKHKNHASVRPLYDLAATIAPHGKPAQTPKPKGGFSLFAKKES